MHGGYMRVSAGYGRGPDVVGEVKSDTRFEVNPTIRASICPVYRPKQVRNPISMRVSRGFNDYLCGIELSIKHLIKKKLRLA